jgi:hypothetical protein
LQQQRTTSKDPCIATLFSNASSGPGSDDQWAEVRSAVAEAAEKRAHSERLQGNLEHA